MKLVIDNYDSFVYNLARYFECFGHSIKVVRNDAITLAEIENLKKFNDLSHIVISPGPCAPLDAGVSLDVIRCFHTKIPILGVCLGHQAIGQAFGAKISRAIIPLHGQASQIIHNQDGIFKDLPNQLMVGRYHSLIVEDLPQDGQLYVTATSQEGEIMALAHKIYPIVGVQFHPESILTDHGYDMIENFLSIGIVKAEEYSR